MGLRFFPIRNAIFCRARAPCLYLLHPLANALLDAFIRWLVINVSAEIIGQALHIRYFGFEIVRVLVSLPVTESLHQLRWGVAQMQWNGFRCRSLNIGLHAAVGGV